MPAGASPMPISQERSPLDLTLELRRIVVEPIFETIAPGSLRYSERLPSVVVQNRRERAQQRIAQALASRGTLEVPQFLKKELFRLIERWSEKGFSDGWSKVEAFEIRCAEEHDLRDPSADQAYRRKVREQRAGLHLWGLPNGEKLSLPPDDLYVNLDCEVLRFDSDENFTTEDRECPRLLLHTQDLVHHNKRILVVGGPGSGKSTLVSHLAVSIAAGTLELKGDRLPFVVRARTLLNSPLNLGSLAAIVEAEHDLVEAAFHEGRAFLLVDGLDEVPRTSISQLCSALEALTASYPDCHYLVTSRPATVYPNLLPDFCSVQLLSMNLDQQRRFVTGWYKAVGLEAQSERHLIMKDVERAAEDLLSLLRTNRPLGQLAETPLLAGILCALHRFFGSKLPQRVAALYEAMLNALIETRGNHWHPTRGSHGLDTSAQRRSLAKLARWMHERAKTEVKHVELASWLHQRGSDDHPSALAESRLLVELRPDHLAFFHLTFQEYLAATELVEDNAYVEMISRYKEPWWHGVIRFAAGLPQADPGRLIYGLLETDKKAKSIATVLAAQCLERSVKRQPSALEHELQRRIKQLLPPRNEEEIDFLANFGNTAAPVFILALDQIDNPEGRARLALVLAKLGYEPACISLSQLTEDHARLRRPFIHTFEKLRASVLLENVGRVAILSLMEIAVSSRLALEILERTLDRAPALPYQATDTPPLIDYAATQEVPDLIRALMAELKEPKRVARREKSPTTGAKRSG